MDWLTCIRDAIDYMEQNLMDNRSPEDVAAHVHISCMYLQKGFQILTGCTLGEYMRNRRLYQAALDLITTQDPVIDIALNYGYETPASFDKAFARFHGATPLEIRRSRAGIRSFQRMRIRISVSGGEHMEFHLEKKDSIQVVGFARPFRYEDAQQKIPPFWNEIISAHCTHIMRGEAPQGMMETYIAAHRIGTFGVCIDDMTVADGFRYIIAGYRGEDALPAEMTEYTIPAGDWAVFDCTMATLQSTTTAIWQEWLPTNSEFELAGCCSVEWYSPEDAPGPDQKCQIWMPVKRKA